MRLANRKGRAVLLNGDSYFDLERHSEGRFDSNVTTSLSRMEELSSVADAIFQGEADGVVDPLDLGPCVPNPRNVFAIGLNYHDHADESGMVIPETPMVFTKFPSCLIGPADPIYISSDSIDYEVELVVVMGSVAKNISELDSEAHIAGVTVGQDVSDRKIQMAGSPPQFSLGKSLDSFGPLGPAVVTMDELGDINDLAIWCEVDGERVQESRTREMIFSPQILVSYLSRFVTLVPGDLIFTGTPPGVGYGFDPPRYLSPGSLIRSGIEGIGVLENPCLAVAAPEATSNHMKI